MSGTKVDQSSFHTIMRDNLIYNRSEIEWYEKFNRFGCMDPYNNLAQTKEYLFFVKPDCHIFTPNTTNLQPALANDGFFVDLANRYPHVVQSLQKSAGPTNTKIYKNPFMAVLSNSVKSTMNFNSLTAEEMDNATNMYGTYIPYRKDAWKGDENIDFSLEFEDTRYLEIYMLISAYERYQRYKTVGLIYPPNIDSATENNDGANFNRYIRYKELHDVFGIYRFIVAEDYQEIVYWAYICGAYFNSVPRDAFNDLKNGESLQYSVDFKAFCVQELDPVTLINFNNLISSKYTIKDHTELPIYNESTDRIVGNWAAFPYISVVDRESMPDANGWRSSQSMAYKYHLSWYN